MTIDRAKARLSIESLNAVGSQVDRGVRPGAEAWARQWFEDHYKVGNVFDDGPECLTLEAAAQLVADAQMVERERLAKECLFLAQLSWAAAEQPYAPEVKMQHEAVAAAMESLAGDLRA